MSNSFVRKKLVHTPPSWVKGGSLFFITINCLKKQESDLANVKIAYQILESVAHYHKFEKWFCRIFLVMPDHLHALLSFPADQGMAATIKAWKSYNAKTLGIQWQRDFFDHRIRNDESWGITYE